MSAPGGSGSQMMDIKRGPGAFCAVIGHFSPGRPLEPKREKMLMRIIHKKNAFGKAWPAATAEADRILLGLYGSVRSSAENTLDYWHEFSSGTGRLGPKSQEPKQARLWAKKGENRPEWYYS